MDFTAEHKKEVEKRIVQAVIDGLEKGILSPDDARSAATFILSKVYEINTEDQLTNFLKELSSQWPIFGNLYTIEQGEAQEQKEEAVAQKVEELTQSGKIDEALTLAKSVTDQTKGIK